MTNNNLPDLATAIARIAAESQAAADAASAYLTGTENRSKLQRYRASEYEMLRVQNAAKAAGISASEYVRSAVLARLDKDGVE